MSNVSLPYYSAGHESMTCGPWHYADADGTAVHLVDDGVPGWDYNRPLVMMRRLTVDVDRLRTDCRLTPDDTLLLTVTAACNTSRWRSCLWQRELSVHGSLSTDLQVELNSTQLAEKFKLQTEVLLKEARPNAERFTAKTAASRLFVEEQFVYLEGRRSRFPVKDADFDEELAHLQAPNAYWHLHWNGGDLDEPAVRALMLYLNSRQEQFVELASTNDPLVLALLFTDAARQLIAAALQDETFVEAEAGHFPEDSIGEIMEHLLAAAFPGQSRNQARELMQQSPRTFDSIIQSTFAPH